MKAQSDDALPGRVARDLAAEVARGLPALSAIEEGHAGQGRAPGKWSPKQILGHLIDSAVNNHHRFVRAQLAPPLVFPGYEQDGWVAVQGYQDRPWAELTALWAALNRHLAHVIGRIDPRALETECTIGSDPPVTLRFVAEDYVRHLRHHVAQILEPGAASGKAH
ncbi:MAG TPA: DinB family protein, partial [Vicinamibacteria bacterium]|nr:DinB family protein [Vicinamibacteria bacterium]